MNILRRRQKENRTKSDSLIELDLIYMSQEAEKFKDEIESLLGEVDGNVIKPRQVRRGHPIQHKWIGICKAIFDGRIDVIKSIPQPCLPKTELQGMIILIGDQYMKTNDEFVIETEYPDKRIQYITITSFTKDTLRAERAIKALIDEDLDNIDRNTYGESSTMQNEGTDVDKSYLQDTSFDRIENPEESTFTDEQLGMKKNSHSDKGFTPLYPSDETKIIEDSLDAFVKQNFPKFHPHLSSGSGHSYLKKNISSSSTRLQSYQKEYEYLLSMGGKTLHLVIHDVKGVSNLITIAKENENQGERTHLITNEDCVDDCVVNALAVKDIRKFIQELQTDRIDVITHIEDEYENVIVKSYLESKFKGVQSEVVERGSIPESCYILVCPANHREKSSETNGIPKDCRTMRLTVHEKVEETNFQESKDESHPTIHLLFEDSKIDEKFYLNQRAKEEILRLLSNCKTADVKYEGKGNKPYIAEGIPETDASSLPPKRRLVYVKYLSDLSKRAFSNFMNRNIGKMELIWLTAEEPVEKGSLCIVVCFTLSRLLDDISAVVKITPQDCTNMLVVIQNCREGISPGPILKHNPDDCFRDFTNILYGDGECYDCDINSRAKSKIRSFIDSY